MNELQKRALLYGSAVVVLGAIGATARFWRADADVTTLLSSADVQLRMAYVLPFVDKHGTVMTSREEMIASAEKHLGDVECIQPGMAITAEFRGFAHMLRGQFEQAADAYDRARRAADCQDEQRDVLAFNQARMLAKAGQSQQALAVFAQNAKALDARFGHQRALEEATILRELGRRPDAVQRLDGVLRDSAAMPMASLQAGVEYLELGLEDQAEKALQRAAADVPIADYHLARLKLQRGDVDTCMQLLARANAARPAEVRQRLSEDAAAWSTVSADARFQQLVGSQPAAPMR
ncbi:MAG: hypothetical protein ACOVRP_13290 [Gemmatimonas sp.]|jgi:tetratricopeptide (TPR) repeat protein